MILNKDINNTGENKMNLESKAKELENYKNTAEVTFQDEPSMNKKLTVTCTGKYKVYSKNELVYETVIAKFAIEEYEKI